MAAKKKVTKDPTKRIDTYMAKHVTFNSLIHAIGGMGIGVLLTHVVFDPHPLRWGGALILASLIGHWYAYRKFKSK